MGNRISSIDFVKGCCIFLVVWAHTIQNMGNEGSFWSNPIHIFICSFHMPIFMLISGYFFSSSIHYRVGEVIRKKFIQLIVPCVGWAAVLVAIVTLQKVLNGEFVSFFAQSKAVLYEAGTRFWFLRSVFVCYVVALISLKIFKKDYVAFLVSFVLFLLMTDNFRLAMDKFMYPYFWTGYFLHKYHSTVNMYKNQLLLIAAFVFAVLLFFWKKEDYIYITGMNFYNVDHLTQRLGIVTYRYLIGLAGSLTFFILLTKIYESKRLYLFSIASYIGRYTLGIYLIHLFWEGMLLKHLHPFGNNFVLFNFVVTPLISVLLIFVCIFIIKLLQRNKFTNFIFLGKEFKEKS